MWRRCAGVAVVLVLVGYLSGCAGVVAVVRGTGSYAIDAPQLSTMQGSRPATLENVRREIGEPDAIADLGGGRVAWRYRDGLRWHGIGLLLIVVPIPLFVPTGVNEAVVTFDAGRAVRLEGRANTSLARAGCLWSPGIPFGVQRGCSIEGYVPPPPELRREHASLWPGAPAVQIPLPSGEGL